MRFTNLAYLAIGILTQTPVNGQDQTNIDYDQLKQRHPQNGSRAPRDRAQKSERKVMDPSERFKGINQIKTNDQLKKNHDRYAKSEQKKKEREQRREERLQQRNQRKNQKDVRDL